MSNMFDIDVSKENQSDIAGLKFDEIIPYRIRTKTRIRESDILGIQNRIISECVELDTKLEQAMAKSEMMANLAEDVKWVRETYSHINECHTLDEVLLYEDDRAYKEIKAEADRMEANAKIEYEEQQHELFQRVCDTEYYGLEHEIPASVTGRQRGGSPKNWTFVSDSTKKMMGEPFATYSKTYFEAVVHTVGESKGQKSPKEAMSEVKGKSKRRKEMDAETQAMGEQMSEQMEQMEHTKTTENPSY